MADFFRRFFDTTDFMPHGHCYLWRPEIVWLHAISDALIFLAYYSIPITLLYFVRKRRDVPFAGVFLLFGAFILACGTTHLVEIITLWIPSYRLAGVVKIITAILSVLTAIVLVPLIPEALQLPSVKAANEKLRKMTFELERSNADLQHFADIASHDLKEPLRMVASYTQLLESRYPDRLDQKGRDYIKNAVDGVVRMEQLINALLTYSRAGGTLENLSPLESQTILQDAIDNLRVIIADTKAVITHDSLPKITADPTQILQVFQNLLANAMKYRDGDSPQIHVSAKRGDREWQFSVRDNGIGVDPKFAEQIFLMFKRLHSQGQYPGNGIGLAVCKKIIEGHHGKIWVESKLGEGATFHFTIPDVEEIQGD